MPEVSVRRVAVLGAGLAGLLSVKSCLECGLEPVCFEQNDQIGGVWLTSELESLDGVRGATVYKSLMTNTSKEMTAISDFPFPRDYPPFLSSKHLLAHYRRYADHFGLGPHVRLATEVTEVAPSRDHQATGRWRVASRPRRRRDDAVEEAATSEIYDAVIVATGVFNTAVTPHYPGQETFRGQVLHSNRFMSGDQFAGKTVLVVGSSHSAGDVAVDTSRHATQVYLSMRDGTWLLSRLGPGGQPSDALGNRRFSSKVPEALTRRIAKSMVERRLDVDNLGLRCKRGLFDGNIMVNEEIHYRIMCGTVQCRPGVREFTPDGVVFEDGTRVECLDAVIFATGYRLSFPFFEDNSIIADDFTDLELYKYVWPARRAHSTLAAVGYVGVAGALSPVVELQARWAAQVFLGNDKLPSVSQRLVDVQRKKEASFQKFGRHRIYFPPVPYCDEIAARFGARPNISRLLLSDPRLALRCYFGPAYPPTWRLNGPHPWAGARDAILSGWENTVYPTRTRKVENPSPAGALSLLGGARGLIGFLIGVVLISYLLMVN